MFNLMLLWFFVVAPFKRKAASSNRTAVENDNKATG
jgi:hypothetical protein